ncbi:MAG: hypothetical protein SGILL_002704 [Bacillariaceae sp.]
MPQLYQVKLHEGPVLEGNNYERFDIEWVLDVSSQPASSSLSSAAASSSSSSSSRVEPGDVLYIPELVTGAGEFEALRFVGNPTEKDPQLLPLLGGGVEYPEFPPEIVAMRKDKDALRVVYASLFDVMLLRMAGGPDTLKDIMGGGDTEIDEFWSSPPVSRTKKWESNEQWIIPLDKCQVKNLSVDPA